MTLDDVKAAVAAYETLVGKAVRIANSFPEPKCGLYSRPCEWDAEDLRLTVGVNSAELHWTYSNYEGGRNQSSEHFPAHYLTLSDAALDVQVAAWEQEQAAREAARDAKYEREREARERETLAALLARYG